MKSPLLTELILLTQSFQMMRKDVGTTYVTVKLLADDKDNIQFKNP